MGDALPTVDLGSGLTATAFSLGAIHSCALLDNATVKCWGNAFNGRLGSGDTVHRGDGPTEMGDNLAVVPLGTGRTVRAISVGANHTCALLDNGDIKCWGWNNTGRLGYGDTNDRGDVPGEMGDSLPAIQLGTGRTATSFSSGEFNNCARLDNGALKCWGINDFGALGLGDISHRGDGPGDIGDNLPAVDLGTRPPAVVVGVTANQTRVVAGEDITYFVTVFNTGGRRLTDVEVSAPDVPDCARALSDLAPSTSAFYDCTYTTTADDVPQMTNQVLVTSAQGAFALSGTRRTRVDPRVERPDAQLRLGDAPFAGNNLYNTSGAGQARTTTVPNRGTANFTVRIQNDGNSSDDFRVTGLGDTTQFAVTYRDGPTNVTTAVVAGTYQLDDFDPGDVHDLTLTIRAKAGTPVGTAITRLTTITSASDPTKKDAVKATVTRR